MVMNLFTIKNNKSNLLFICVLFSVNSLNAQSYYGENGLGRMDLINDSMYSVSFYAYGNIVFNDTGTYHLMSDTIFLNSIIKQNFEFITESRAVYSNEIESFSEFSEYAIKIYRKKTEKENEYQFIYESLITLSDYDSARNEIFCPVLVTNGDIIILEYFSPYKYRRFMVETPNKYELYKLRFRIIDKKIDRVYFDNFPLKIKNNKLIPLDEEKNFKCWVDNGFYFPTMKKEKTSKKTIKTKRILLSDRGIQGLVNKIMIDE